MKISDLVDKVVLNLSAFRTDNEVVPYEELDFINGSIVFRKSIFFTMRNIPIFDDLQSAEVEYADVRHDIEIQLDVRGIDIENNIIRFSTSICSLDTFIEDFEISRTIYDSVTTERKIEMAAENYFDSMMQSEFSRINVHLKQKGN